MDGAVIQGGTFGPYHTFGVGAVIENGVFVSPVYFGEGATLVNPTFTCGYKTPWSEVGPNSTINGGSWDCVNFGENTTLKSGGGGKFSVGGGSAIDGGPRATDGVNGGAGVETAGGVIITRGEVLLLSDGVVKCSCVDGRWDEEVLKKGYMIVGDDGTATVTVPKMLIVCEGGE